MYILPDVKFDQNYNNIKLKIDKIYNNLNN